MLNFIHKKKAPLAVLIGLIVSGTYTNESFAATNQQNDDNTSAVIASPDQSANDSTKDVMVVRAKAEEALKQQPGASIITSEDVEKSPPVNDLSDIIRRMPGVNLTGNSANGSRGNNRQIDIRGMGPENTLILVDGNPITSRNSVRYSRKGERDTRGDSNWVPVEMVDHIDVLRGPAAAHYGSGAMGGVVNIITKRPTNEWHGSASMYTNQPEDSKEGATKRLNFSLSGPLIEDVLTMRLYGSLNKTDADDYNINSDENGSYAAGREGVRNRDISAMVTWKIDPQQYMDFNYSYGRQGNIYTGDTQYSNSNLSPNGLVQSLNGNETNKMYRQAYNITHNGLWDWGQSKLSLSYEQTNNTRLDEGSTGRVEGMINSNNFSTSRYKSYRISDELTIPFNLFVYNTLTVGAEWNKEELNDPASMRATSSNVNNIGGVSGNPNERSSKNSQELSAVYLEDTIDLLENTVLIPGLRLDYSDKFGTNWSPSLNMSINLTEDVTLKAGIARVFKAPNLYQVSEGYLLASTGNGCPIGTSVSCYLIGNEDLDPETSVNKEVGLQWTKNGYAAGLTYFRNDYHNKIVSGTDLIDIASNNYHVYRWENGGRAVTQGFEANFTVPVIDDKLDWRTNATYMTTSKYKDNGNPLSLIPKYTVNTMLDWQTTDKLSTSLIWTMYGRQKPRTTAEIRKEVGAMSDKEVPAYSIVGINANYEFNKNLRFTAGIRNLLDKRIYRENEGASTYNEPGRSYYAGITTSF